MSDKKELQHRCICPHCRKAFDNRYEGFVVSGYLICADCYHKLGRVIRGVIGKDIRKINKIIVH